MFSNSMSDFIKEVVALNQAKYAAAQAASIGAQLAPSLDPSTGYIKDGVGFVSEYTGWDKYKAWDWISKNPDAWKDLYKNPTHVGWYLPAKTGATEEEIKQAAISAIDFKKDVELKQLEDKKSGASGMAEIIYDAKQYATIMGATTAKINATEDPEEKKQILTAGLVETSKYAPELAQQAAQAIVQRTQQAQAIQATMGGADFSALAAGTGGVSEAGLLSGSNMMLILGGLGLVAALLFIDQPKKKGRKRK